MDASWIERLELFRWAILAALCAGLVCPLVGTFLLVRRTSFYGITLPQFATAGVVFGFVVLPWWVATFGFDGLSAEQALAESHSAMNYHLAWAAVFTFGGLIALVLTSRRGGSEIGRVAAAFAIANAATYLFGRMSPVGKSMVDELLAGEILGVGRHGFETLSAVLALVLFAIFLFHRDFLLVSYDRESAVVLGKPVLAFEVALNLITGITVATGTMILGPTLLFGLLVLPPLAARRWASSALSFHVLAAVLGVLAAVGGVIASFELDLPLGAAIVGVAGIELVPGLFVRPRA
jgi:ABC-type Mn2+/Zn2+ transport system permease subunit